MKIKISLLILFLIGFYACENDDVPDIQEEQAIELEDIAIDIVSFEFTTDTGNNSSRLQYQIKFSNPNTINITGFYKITLNTDGLITNTLSSNRSPCFSINANSQCTVNFDEEESFDIGMINSIVLISVEYDIEN